MSFRVRDKVSNFAEFAWQRELVQHGESNSPYIVFSRLAQMKRALIVTTRPHSNTPFDIEESCLNLSG